MKKNILVTNFEQISQEKQVNLLVKLVANKL